MQHVYNLLCPWCVRQYTKTLGFELVFMCVHCVLEYVTWEWKKSMPKLALPLDFDFQHMCKIFNPLLMWLHFLAHLFILYVRRFLISKPFRAIMKLGKQWKETNVYFQPFSSCYRWVQIHIYGYIQLPIPDFVEGLFTPLNFLVATHSQNHLASSLTLPLEVFIIGT